MNVYLRSQGFNDSPIAEAFLFPEIGCLDFFFHFLFLCFDELLHEERVIINFSGEGISYSLTDHSFAFLVANVTQLFG